MTYGNIARPYPETVEALEEKLREAEHEIEALRLRIQGLQQTIEHQAKQDAERIARQRREIERLNLVVGDNALRIAALEADNEAAVNRIAEHVRDNERIRGELLRFYGQPDLPPTRAETDEIVTRVFRRDQCARPETIECRVWECQVRNRCRYAETEANEDLD